MGIHITLLYGGLAGLLLVVLSFNVMYQWVRVTGTGQATDQAMRRAENLVSNFVECVPLTLLLIGVLEANGAGTAAVHTLGTALIASRLLHAFGSGRMRGASLMHFLGAQITFLVTIVASIGSIYLYLFTAL
jgi:uncharacterized membrane protein YecN with MAPEG domain